MKVTFESSHKNYYITSCLINMKPNETVLKQTRKFVNKNLKKWLQQTRPWFWNPHEELGTQMKSWCVFLKQTIYLTCLQSEHDVRIMKRQLVERDFASNKIPHIQGSSETAKQILQNITVISRGSRDSSDGHHSS